jgi:hypothetical protein
MPFAGREKEGRSGGLTKGVTFTALYWLGEVAKQNFVITLEIMVLLLNLKSSEKKTRVRREFHAQFCKRPGLKYPNILDITWGFNHWSGSR